MREKEDYADSENLQLNRKVMVKEFAGEKKSWILTPENEFDDGRQILEFSLFFSYV